MTLWKKTWCSEEVRNESTTEMFFDWVGSDGTKNLTYKLQDSLGYGGFAGPRAVFEEGFIEALRQIEGYEEFTKALEEAGSDEERNTVLATIFESCLETAVAQPCS